MRCITSQSIERKENSNYKQIDAQPTTKRVQTNNAFYS